jgi:hypothetical protein
MDGSVQREFTSGPLRKPETIAEAGVHRSVLEDLALKILYLFGPFSVLDLSKHLRLSLAVGDEIFHRMRTQQFCEVSGLSQNIPNLAITSRGRARALELLSLSQYSSAAPVSLGSYIDQVRQQSVRNVEVHQAEVERAFAHMVLDRRMLARFGTALNSGAPIFLYGTTGVGKTMIAETLSRLLAADKVWIPFAVEVDGQIITVYDPVIHRAVEDSAPWSCDRRWILCHRPAVVVGGELTIDMLNLQFNPIAKFYVGPLQMKANNGALIIDDFGRQRLQPEELFNRWIVPLDRRIDFLTLAGGKTIEIPFELLVVFATNLDPGTMMEDAALRRIQSKIKIEAASDDQFREIFRRVAKEFDLDYDKSLLNEIISVIYCHSQLLRPCYARDIVNQVRWSAKYENRKPLLDRTSVMRAVEAYFLPEA